MQYPRLFGQLPSGITPAADHPPDGRLVPDPRIPTKDPDTTIDKVFAEKASKETLLRVKAMEMTILFLNSRPSGHEEISTLFDTIYQKLKHGTTERTGVSQGVYR